MKRGLKYFLLIVFTLLMPALSSQLQSRGIQPEGWFPETLWVAVLNIPQMLLLYTAGYDPKLKGWLSLYARIIFWTFVVLIILGRILPYVPWLQ